MENLPKLAKDYDEKMVRKIFYNESVRYYKCLNIEKKRLLVLFRHNGIEEEYTMAVEHNNMVKVDEKVFSFSDKWDNYNLILVNYEHRDLVDERNMPDPYVRHTCSLCGDGGCPSCQPNWFI